MNATKFFESIDSKTKPMGISRDLEALWEDGVGNWEGAHDLCQAPDAEHGDRIHAYLHRKEGDLMNAGYWYSRCGLSIPNVSLSEEWKQLVEDLLN